MHDQYHARRNYDHCVDQFKVVQTETARNFMQANV